MVECLGNRSKLKLNHIAHLVKQETLKEWAHLSLSQRCKMFHRVFPEIKISASTLHRLYLRHRIAFKQVKRTKPEVDLLYGRYRQLSQ